MLLKKFIASALVGVMCASSLSAGTLVYGAEGKIMGDVDSSGSLTSNDAAMVLAYVIDSGRYPDFPAELADVDGKKGIDSSDAAFILEVVRKGENIPDAVETTTEATTKAEESTEATTATEATTKAEESTEATTATEATTKTEESTEATTKAETTTESTTATEATTKAEESTEATTSAYYDMLGGDIAGKVTADKNVIIDTKTQIGAFTFNPTYKYNTKGTPYVVNGEEYADYIQLSGTSSLTTASVSFSAPTGGKLRIIAGSANSSTVRDLVVYYSDGTMLKTLTMPTGADTPADETVILPKAGKYVIGYTMGNINIYRLTFTGTGDTQVETTTKPDIWEPTTETTTFNGDTSDGVVVDNFKDLVNELGKANNKVYVKGTIDCSERINLTQENANVEVVGLPNADGTAASLNFATLRDNATSSGSGVTGIRIPGTYYSFKNIIVENAGDCGIRITGGNCTFENCIFRYNNNSGVSITSGGHDNKFLYVDSYRNGDVIQKNGADADGFSVKLNAGENNYFYNCRAWENSDDGWDSYDRGTPYIGSVYYIECLTYNNGNPYVFTGDYDYEQGNPLDKNLVYVQEILRQDPDFETKYNNRRITSWPKVTVKLLGTSNTYDNIHSKSWAGNPNGFKFGSAQTPTGSYRYIKNCIAFGHKNTPNQTPAKGFDQNNGSAGYDIINALSFDNGQNYWMDKMHAISKAGVFYSFNSGQTDISGDLDLTTPTAEKEKQLRDEVNSKFGYILDQVYSNKLAGKVLFNVFE